MNQWEAYNAIKGRILKNWHVKGPESTRVASISDQLSGDQQVEYAAFIARACTHHAALVEALKALTKEIDLSKLNVRKDFSLLNAHAWALKVIDNATK